MAAFALLAAAGLGVTSAFAQTPAPAVSPGAPPQPLPTPTAFPYIVTAPSSIARLNLDADSIAFLFNRYRVEADGHVVVHLDDGAVVSGDTFSMDLRLNRLVIAGHVHLQSGSIGYDGAAFAEFFDDNRGYFLPVFGEPDRWTFIGSNYGLPYLGREIPFDAFFLPNITGESVFLYARSAVIWPRDALLFHGTRVNVIGLKAPGGTIYLNFSSNPNFHQNSLVGAQVDVGYPFQGGRWQYTTFHARYSNPPGAYFGLEQHFAWDNAYVVASLNPIDRAQKQYNLLASDRLSHNFQLDTFQQINLTQYGWTTPQTAAYFGNYTATASLHNSFVRASYNIWNYGLSTTMPPLDPDHPTQTSFLWNGFDHRVWQLPLNFKLRSGFSNADDTYGVGQFNGTGYTNLWSTFYGITLYTNSIKLFRDTYLVGSYDRQLTFFSLPEHLDSGTATASLSHLIGTKAAFSITYQNTNAGVFAGPQQLAIYPPSTPVNPYNNQPSLGYAAFIGFATSRTFSYLLSYTPNPRLSIALNFQHYRDFPEPVGLVLGRPPDYFNADVRMRLTQQLSLEFQRAYYFNWYGAKWSPTFAIQFGP
jgi:hypothetical protein